MHIVTVGVQHWNSQSFKMGSLYLQTKSIQSPNSELTSTFMRLRGYQDEHSDLDLKSTTKLDVLGLS